MVARYSPIQGCKRELTNLSDDCHGMFNTLTDYHTLDITYGTATNILQLTKKLPWVVMFNGLRACVDVNREEKCAFEAPKLRYFMMNIMKTSREVLKKYMLKTWEKIIKYFCLTFMERASNSKYDIIIGTGNGETLCQLSEHNPGALWKSDGLISSLRMQGVKVHPMNKDQPEVDRYKGGYTIMTYGGCKSRSKGNDRLNAIQLELTKSQRSYSAREIIKMKLANSIVKFVYSNNQKK